jgi:hypothetical protein
MSAKVGIRRARKGCGGCPHVCDFAQLEALDVWGSIDVTSLTTAQRRGALRAIKSHQGKTRWPTQRTDRLPMADRKEAYMPNPRPSSPTVSTDALMLSTLIDAHERRMCATADIAGSIPQGQYG